MNTSLPLPLELTEPVLLVDDLNTQVRAQMCSHTTSYQKCKTFNAAELAPEVSGSTYTWEMHDMAPIPPEPMSPAVVNLSPRIVIDYSPSGGAKDKTFAKFLALLRENPHKKVFVHCRYGDDRTGMMVAAYRMAVENWSADEAWEEMQVFGYNHTVCFPLRPYEKKFPEHLKKNGDLRGPVVAAR